jgi:ferredoxin
MENVEGRDFEDFYERIFDKKTVEKEFNAYFAEPKDKTLKQSNELKEIKEKEINESKENINEKNEDEEKDIKTYKDPFVLYFANNIPLSQSYFVKTFKCEYCESHCKSCLIANDENITIYEFFARQKIEREFIVHADFSIFKSNFTKFYFENSEYDDPIMSCRGDISIYECFEQFSKESTIEKEKEKDKEKLNKELDKENMFFCKNCNKNLKGFKKIEIFKAPNILIIQLKRFKLKAASLMELVQNRKNEAHVDFQGYLDLRRFVLGPEKDKAKYELLSVCQHTGKMGAGKYSAVVRCIKDNNWYEFVDENFKEIGEDVISNPAAYLLVYRKIEVEESKEVNKEAIGASKDGNEIVAKENN